VVLQPLQGFVEPWLVGLHEGCMPALAEQGYDGIEVSTVPDGKTSTGVS
jgi:hypothetical protein